MMRHKTIIAAAAAILALSGPADAAEQMEPLVAHSGGFTVARDGAGITVSVAEQSGREIARYDLPDCGVCGGDGACAREGVFALTLAGTGEPLIGASCHGAEGQRFFLLAPARDRSTPVFQVRGDSFAAYAIHPDRVEVQRDRGGQTAAVTWRPGVAPETGETAWARTHAAAAEGREIAGPAPVADPEFQALEEGLHAIASARDAEALVAMAAPDVLTSFGGDGTVGELRQLIAEPWFWDEFARLLAGGGAMPPEWNREGRMAVFPAAFSNWPDDLDAFGFVYGDRAGAVLRAGPSEHAPALMPLHRRILARGPYLEAGGALREAGWSYLCTASRGCGYVRDADVRSPIDYRAILTQAGPGAAWVLQTLVAGD